MVKSVLDILFLPPKCMLMNYCWKDLWKPQLHKKLLYLKSRQGKKHKAELCKVLTKCWRNELLHEARGSSHFKERNEVNNAPLLSFISEPSDFTLLLSKEDFCQCKLSERRLKGASRDIFLIKNGLPSRLV